VLLDPEELGSPKSAHPASFDTSDRANPIFLKINPSYNYPHHQHTSALAGDEEVGVSEASMGMDSKSSLTVSSSPSRIYCGLYKLSLEIASPILNALSSRSLG
jgi:hypothetical protein